MVKWHIFFGRQLLKQIAKLVFLLLVQLASWFLSKRSVDSVVLAELGDPFLDLLLQAIEYALDV